MEGAQLLALGLLASVAAGLVRETYQNVRARRRLDDYLQWMLTDVGRPART